VPPKVSTIGLELGASDRSLNAPTRKSGPLPIFDAEMPELLEYEVIWGHIDILVVVVRRLSRRWKVKTLLAGPSPTSPIEAEVTNSPISNTNH